MIKLSQGQITALEDFLTVYKDFSNKGKIYQIDGPAGTGKTELAKNILEILNDKKIIICAPTHKACQVLIERLGKGVNTEVVTCHQFLKAKITYTRSGKQKWTFSTKSLEVPDLLIIDEVSMIDDIVFKEFEFLVKTRNLFILTFGDSCQLPPVGENKTRFYTSFSIQKSLKENMRNENVKYNEFLGKIREMIILLEDQNYDPNYNVKKLLDLCKPYTELCSLQSFPNVERISSDVLDDYTSEINNKNVIMLAHRTNKKTNTVKNLNEKLRKALFPSSNEKFEIGDKLIFTDCLKSTDSVYHTNDIVFVETCKKIQNKFYDKEFQVYELGIDKNKTKIYYLHPSEEKRFGAYHELMHNSLKNTEELAISNCGCPESKNCLHKQQIDTIWREYHIEYKNIYSPIDYAYCLSIHKSQGSTYDKVYLYLSDFMWFLSNGDYDNFFKLFYVGVSRTKTTTVLF